MSELPPVKIPRVARSTTRTKVAPFALGLGLIGTGVFATLASHRAARQDQVSTLPPLRATTITAPAPPPPTMVAQATVPIPTGVPVAIAPPPPPPVVAPYQPPRAYPPVAVAPPKPSDGGAAARARARIAAPALIVDLAPARPAGETARGQSASYDNAFPAAALMKYASLQDPTGASIAAAGPAPGADASREGDGMGTAGAFLFNDMKLF